MPNCNRHRKIFSLMEMVPMKKRERFWILYDSYRNFLKQQPIMQSPTWTCMVSAKKSGVWKLNSSIRGIVSPSPIMVDLKWPTYMHFFCYIGWRKINHSPFVLTGSLQIQIQKRYPIKSNTVNFFNLKIHNLFSIARYKGT